MGILQPASSTPVITPGYFDVVASDKPECRWYHVVVIWWTGNAAVWRCEVIPPTAAGLHPVCTVSIWEFAYLKCSARVRSHVHQILISVIELAFVPSANHRKTLPLLGKKSVIVIFRIIGDFIKLRLQFWGRWRGRGDIVGNGVLNTPIPQDSHQMLQCINNAA